MFNIPYRLCSKLGMLFVGVMMCTGAALANEPERLIAPSMPMSTSTVRTDILDLVEQRFFKEPQCVVDKNCALVEQMQIQEQGAKLLVTYWISARNASTVVLPTVQGARLEKVQDPSGKSAWFAMGQHSSPSVRLERGQNRLEAIYALNANVSEINVVHNDAIGKVSVQSSGSLEIIGDGYQSKVVRLIRKSAPINAPSVLEKEPKEQADQWIGFNYLHVLREISIDPQGVSGVIVVERKSNLTRAQQVSVPIQRAERILGDKVKMNDKEVLIDFAPNQRQVILNTLWESSPGQSSKGLVFASEQSEGIKQTWRIKVNPRMHVSFEGVLPYEGRGGDFMEFLPFTGQTLTVAIKTQKPKEGVFVAYDGMEVRTNSQQRVLEHQISVRVRASAAGSVQWKMPENFKVMSLKTKDGLALQNQWRDGVLQMDIGRGEQTVVLDVQEPRSDWWIKAPKVQLDAPLANMSWVLVPSMRNWVVWSQSDGLGPAILIWGLMIVLAALSWGLARFGRAPFFPPAWGWFFLFAPLMTVGAGNIVMILIFIGLLEWKYRCYGSYTSEQSMKVKHWNVIQGGLLAFALICLIHLLQGVYSGLMGTPNMMIESFHAEPLYFFMDKSDGVFFDAGLLILPMWWWRILILVWALVMVKALAGRAGGIWGLMCLGGLWHKSEKKSKVQVVEESVNISEVQPIDSEDPEGTTRLQEQADPEPQKADDVIDGDFSKGEKS